MTDSVALDSTENRSVWDLLEEGGSIAKRNLDRLRIQFLDYVCPQNIVTGSREFHFIPLSVENFLGAALYPSYKFQSGGEVSSSKYSHYNEVVQRIGKALASQSPRPGLNFEFAVVNDWSINAWCLPGGKIAINLGILNAMERDIRDYGGKLPTFEEKVAAVLSHEITHATARHFGRTMEFRILMAGMIKVLNFSVNYFVNTYYDQKIKTADPSKESQQIEKEKSRSIQSINKVFDSLARIAVSGLGKCNSRAHELEADKYGMILLHQVGKGREAGLNPESAKAAIWLQNFFIQQKGPSYTGFFEWISHLTSTHPSSHERLQANQRTWQELNKI